MHPAADYRVDIHVKIGILSQHLQFFVEDFQALLRNVVRIDVVDRNLQPLKAGAVQALDSFRNQQVPIRDHPCHNSVQAHATDNLIQLRMQQRLATADGNHGSPEFTKLIYAAENQIQRHWLGEVVVLVAVFACQITTTHGNKVRQQRMVGGEESPGNLAPAVN